MKKLPDLLFSRAQKNPELKFLQVKGGLELSYFESDRQVNELAKKWTGRGMRRGAVVACLLEESPESILAILALIRIGAVYAPLPVPQPPSSLRAQLVRLNPGFFIYSKGFEGLMRSEKSFGLKAVALPKLAQGRSLSSDKGLVDLPQKKDTDTAPTWDPSQQFTFLFTSGSSGLPKIAGHSLGHFLENALASNKSIPFGARDAWLLRLPLFHVGGISILFRVLLGGGIIHLPSARDKVAESLEDATHVSLVSTQFRRIVESRNGIKKLAGLKAVLLGGGPMREEFLRKIRSSKI
ncbi:MAG: AMP-binding protein, partial [Spirochaetia bacterium]|nr:AMP-binding protein [Spirochaetia bacterium]